MSYYIVALIVALFIVAKDFGWIPFSVCCVLFVPAIRAEQWMRCIKHIPIAWGHPLLGHLDVQVPLSPEMDLHIQIMDIINQHGSVVQMFWLDTHVVLVNDPKLAKTVLDHADKTQLNNGAPRTMISEPKSENQEEHRTNIRTSLNKDFARFMSKKDPSVRESEKNPSVRESEKNPSVREKDLIDRLYNIFAQKAERNESFFLGEVFGRFTLDYLFNCAFGIDFDFLGANEEEFLKLNRASEHVFKNVAYSACPFYHAMSKNRGCPVTKSGLSFLNTVGLGCIQHHNDQAQVIRTHCVEVLRRMREREASGISRTCFETEMTKKHCESEGKSKNISELLYEWFLYFFPSFEDKSKTKSDLLDELFLFFLAGHETTATALSWLLFEIVANDLQAKCADAAKNYYNLDEDKMNHRYLKAVIKESLRMNTVVSRPLLRKSDKEITHNVLLKNGETVEVVFPKGTNFLMNLHALNHSEEWTDTDLNPNSTEFKPERFLVENPKTIFSYSIGNRDCIGKDMAEGEMFTVLLNVLAKFEFSLADKTLAGLVADEKLEEARNLLRRSDITMRPTKQLRMFAKKLGVSGENSDSAQFKNISNSQNIFIKLPARKNI